MCADEQRWKGVKLRLTERLITCHVPTAICATLLFSAAAYADLSILPSGIAGGNLDSPAAAEIEMAEATVNMTFGQCPPLPKLPSGQSFYASLTRSVLYSFPLSVDAEFVMRNTGTEPVTLWVMYPELAEVDVDKFHVTSDGEDRTLFALVNGRGKNARFKCLSSVKPQKADLPHLKLADMQRVLLSKQSYGLLHLMVWRETFAPGKDRHIHIEYSARGVNLPPMARLGKMHEGYFQWRYLLTTGAAWKGPIGKETINLRFDESWNTPNVKLNGPGHLVNSGDNAWVYTLVNEDPQKDAVFIIQKGQKANVP